MFKRKNIEKNKNVNKRQLNWLTKACIFVDICAAICFFLAYGPFSFARDYLVTTALSTGHHKYFAYILYSESYVEKIASKNSIVDAQGKTDVSQITIIDTSNITVYENVYEQQVLEREEGNDLYKIVPISEGSISGYMTVIYQPERLTLVTSPYFNGAGVSTMCKLNDAILGVNGGGYYVSESNGIFPMDNMIVNGKIYYDGNNEGRMVGMNSDGILMLMKATAQEALDAGMVWGVDFGPFLIVNGQKATISGSAGGYQPRTAIGQRKDGIVILLTIDGRGGGNSRGANFNELIELFEKYNCYNAANLDGGGSSTLYANNKVINNPVSYQGSGERHVLDAIVLK